MRLSEAIRLGSLAIQNPRKCDVTTCAIGMACEAIGKAERESLHNYTVLAREWPWTEPNYYVRLTNLFDGDVMEGKMTLEALCDQVRVWEDELAAKGINVEQVTMAAELNQPASQATEKSEKVNA